MRAFPIIGVHPDINICLDLPRLEALNAVWRRTPPAPVLFARIATWLGAWSPEQVAAGRPKADADAEAEAWLALLPRAPLPKILTPEAWKRAQGMLG